MPTTDDEQAVRQQYLPLADALAKQLLHLDARMALLVSKLGDENWENHGDSPKHNGWLVCDRVIPCWQWLLHGLNDLIYKSHFLFRANSRIAFRAYVCCASARIFALTSLSLPGAKFCVTLLTFQVLFE